MERIGLDENFIQIVDSSGKIIGYGGNQKWFSDSLLCNVKGQGCGVIAAVDVLFYLEGKRRIPFSGYAKKVDEFVGKNIFARLFMAGDHAVGILPLQMAAFINTRLDSLAGIGGEGKLCRFKWNGIKGHQDLYKNIRRMLENNIPVICSIYAWRKKLKLYKFDEKQHRFVDNYLQLQNGGRGHLLVNNHYVTITGVIEDTGKYAHGRMLEISSWGEKYYIDYDEYISFSGKSIISKYCSNILIFS